MRFRLPTAISLVLLACDGRGELVIAPPPATTAGPNVAFVDDGGGSLHAGDERALAVTVDPPGATLVRFALLGDVGDASLDRSSVTTGADGRGTVTLHAPTRPTTITVRASVDGGGSATDDVAIVGGAVGTLQVRVGYQGTRMLPAVEVGAYPNVSCAQIDAATQPLGDLVAATPPKPNGDPAAVANVPAGERVAVLARAGGDAVGCTDLATPLGVGEARAITVALANTPLHLATASLAVALDVSPADPESFAALLTAWSTRFVAGFLGDENTAASALLDTIEAALPTETAGAFQGVRKAADWDLELGALFGATGGAEIVTRVWLPAATTAMSASPGPIQGQLDASSSTAASLALTRLMRIDATDDPLPTLALTWAAQADDTVSLGSGVIPFGPTRLLGRAVEDVARTDHPDAASAIDALRKETSCDAVASTLVGSGLDAFDGCDEGCLAGLCESALATMWTRALTADESANTLASLQLVGISGAAAIDDDADIRGFNGTWSGTFVDPLVTADMGSSKVKGAAAATTPSAPK